MESLKIFQTSFGTLELERRPPAAGRPLQAWDAADAYLLEQLAGADTPGPLLLINDAFGALAAALNERQPHSWGDSETARLALQDNLARNSLADRGRFIPSTENPSGPYAAVLWRIPKSLALLRQQAALLRPQVDAGTRIFAGGMVKHLPEQALSLLRGLGAVDVLPAQKKARLFAVAPQPDAVPPRATIGAAVTVADYDLQLRAGPAVFAHDKLDIGARFLLEQLPKLPPARRCADLGCGNGVLGLALQRLRGDIEISFFDESYQAIAAARANHAANIGTAPAQFQVDDGLSHYRGEPFDLILCNPPFHQSHVVGDQIARRLFAHSELHLRRDGELWIVGNRHLQYHIALKRVFGNCRQIASNPKFVVLAARKS